MQLCVFNPVMMLLIVMLQPKRSLNDILLGVHNYQLWSLQWKGLLPKWLPCLVCHVVQSEKLFFSLQTLAMAES